jgi:outer membrane receptor protein involved in Fe transport
MLSRVRDKLKTLAAVVVFLTCMIFSVPAGAQPASGTLRGTVKDEGGNAVVAATVSIAGPKTTSTQTDAQGAFAFSGIPSGTYSITVAHAGYQTASQSGEAVSAGTAVELAVVLHAASFSSLKTIAVVSIARAGQFNTSTAAVNEVPAQTFGEQAQPQVTQVLNQVPGVQISYPGSSANGAVPGAITFPNVRNGLSYETASLIDGHPLSVGLYGDYVTTFLNSYLLQSVEVIKGPGAMAPEVNYAINGTVNFRTKDPTPTTVPFYTIGFTNLGGSIGVAGASSTIGRFGYVAGIATYNDPSPLSNTQAYIDPTYGNPTFYGSPKNSYNQLFGSCSLNPLQNLNPKQYISAAYNSCTLLGTVRIGGDYYNLSELLKFRYRIGSNTFVTASYFGSQSTANQSGNTSSVVPALFTPAKGYSGSLAAGSTVNYLNGYFAGGQNEYETNNEPIFQGEISSSIGNDTIVGRYYHASIARLQSGGNADPFAPTTLYSNLYGTASGFPTFNGEQQSLSVWDYWNSTEIDKLFGYSLEYTHPFGETDQLTFAADANQSTSVDYDAFLTYNYNGKQCPLASQLFCMSTTNSLPAGAQQNFTTFLLRNRAQITPQFAATVSLYQNVYHSTYPTSCASTYVIVTQQPSCTFDSSTPTHFDPRLGLEWRPHPNVAVRASAGSAIAPPYLYVLSQLNGEIAFTPGNHYATQYVNAGNLHPETAFGYDIGADYAFGDHVTYASTDLFLNNLYGQFLQSQYLAGTCTVSPCPAGGVPLYKSSYVNLSNARYEGIEVSLTRAPHVGWGFVLSGSTQRGYPYNLPPGFYCSFVVTKKTPCKPSTYDTNLAVVSGTNYLGEYVDGTGGTTSGVDNQSVPYLQGNAEINYRFPNGAFALFGDTLYGKNNSLNEPPFGVAYASISYPLNNVLSFQVSGSNLFNAWAGLFPVFGGGVGVPLANGQTGATVGNVLGPASYRFLFTQRFGDSGSQ